MHAKELIGEIAIRTEPVISVDGTKDHSYCHGHGVKIVGATDTHVVIESPFSSKPYALDYRWVDGWVSFESLIKGGHQ